MIEGQRVKGTWWLSSAPENKLPGELSFGSDGTVLALEGIFGSPLRDLIDEVLIIHGIDTNQNEWSLLKTYESAIYPRFPFGHSSSRFFVNLTIEGGYINSLESLEISSVCITVPGLSESISNNAVTFQQTGREVNIHWAAPPDFEVNVPSENLRLKSKFFPETDYSRDSAQVRHTASILIEFDSPVSFERTFETTSSVERLLTLLHTVPFKHSEMRLVLKLGSFVSVHSRHLWNDNVPALQAEKIFVPVLTLVDSNCFDQIVNEWFALDRKASLSLIWFCSLLGSKQPYRQMEFVYLIQTLESLHRAVIGGDYMTDENFKTIKAALIAAIPEDVTEEHRDSLKSAINFGNKLSQRTRLRQLLELLPVALRECIALDTSECLSKLVNTRNYLTHLDEKSERKAMRADEIAFSIPGLQFLFVVVALTLIGVSPEVLLARLDNCKMFRSFANRSPWTVRDHQTG